jgi:hypothetical protein
VRLAGREHAVLGPPEHLHGAAESGEPRRIERPLHVAVEDRVEQRAERRERGRVAPLRRDMGREHARHLRFPAEEFFHDQLQLVFLGGLGHAAQQTMIDLGSEAAGREQRQRRDFVRPAHGVNGRDRAAERVPDEVDLGLAERREAGGDGIAEHARIADRLRPAGAVAREIEGDGDVMGRERRLDVHPAFAVGREAVDEHDRQPRPMPADLGMERGARGARGVRSAHFDGARSGKSRARPSALAGATPRSVISPVTSRAGVTSKA